MSSERKLSIPRAPSLLRRFKRAVTLALLTCGVFVSTAAHADPTCTREVTLGGLMIWNDLPNFPPFNGQDLFGYAHIHNQDPELATTSSVVAGTGGTNIDPQSPIVQFENTGEIPSCLTTFWLRGSLEADPFLGPPEIVWQQTRIINLDDPGPHIVSAGVGAIPMVYVSEETPVGDADGDGLLDCEETDGGIDVNCDGALVEGEDILFSDLDDVPADPAIPDIYVEVDWADCSASLLAPGVGVYPQCGLLNSSGTPDRRSFEPPQEVFDRVEAEFARNEHNLHFVRSGPFPATMGHRIDGPLATSTDTAYWLTTDPSYRQRVNELFFGEPGEAHEVVAEKRTFMRHHLWGHAIEGNAGGRVGLGPQNFAVVHLDPNEPAYFEAGFPAGGQVAGQTATWDESYQLWAIVVMHELGHSLGLGHGGVRPSDFDRLVNLWDDQAYKPNYLSVMNYRYRDGLDGRLGPMGTVLPQLRFNEEERTVNQCVTDPSRGSPIPDGGIPELNPFGHPESFTLQYACPNKLMSSWLGGGAVDWDCDGSGLDAMRREFDVMPFVCSKYSLAETPPARQGGDVLYGAVIENQNAALPPSSVPLADDQLSGNRILPGVDNVLQTVVALGDWERGGFISPGPDRQCNTPAPAANEINPAATVGSPNPDPRSFKQCEIPAKSDWDNLRVKLWDGPRAGNAATGSQQGDITEPTLEELREDRKRSAVTDLGIEASSEFDSTTGTIDVEYTVTNSGFMPAMYVGINFDVPPGVEFAGCSGDATFNCVPYGGVVSAGIDEIAPLSSVILVVRLAMGCPSPGEEFAVVAQVVSLSRDPDLTNNQVATNVEHPDVLRVDDAPRPWIVQNSGGQPVPVEQSQGALNLGCGNLQFESPTFDTFELGSVGTALEVDVFVPSGSWPGWVGDLQLHVDVPSGGLWNAWAGYQSLGGVPQGTWTTVSYPLTAQVQAVLLEDLPDARLRFSSNVATCAHQVLFRNVRFGGALTCQAPSDPVVPRVSSSVLTFDLLGDWAAEQAVLTASSVITQGSGAVAIDPSGWGRMVSREFSTTELASVTSTMAFDVHIPDLPPDFYWLGGLNLFVDCPNVGLWNRWVGYHALQILFDDQFNTVTVEVELPEDVTGALTNPVAQCRMALEFSSNPQFGGFIVDNGGFVQ